MEKSSKCSISMSDNNGVNTQIRNDPLPPQITKPPMPPVKPPKGK